LIPYPFFVDMKEKQKRIKYKSANKMKRISGGPWDHVESGLNELF